MISPPAPNKEYAGLTTRLLAIGLRGVELAVRSAEELPFPGRIFPMQLEQTSNIAKELGLGRAIQVQNVLAAEEKKSGPFPKQLPPKPGGTVPLGTPGKVATGSRDLNMLLPGFAPAPQLPCCQRWFLLCSSSLTNPG